MGLNNAKLKELDSQFNEVLTRLPSRVLEGLRDIYLANIDVHYQGDLRGFLNLTPNGVLLLGLLTDPVAGPIYKNEAKARLNTCVKGS